MQITRWLEVDDDVYEVALKEQPKRDKPKSEKPKEKKDDRRNP